MRTQAGRREKWKCVFRPFGARNIEKACFVWYFMFFMLFTESTMTTTDDVRKGSKCSACLSVPCFNILCRIEPSRSKPIIFLLWCMLLPHQPPHSHPHPPGQNTNYNLSKENPPKSVWSCCCCCCWKSSLPVYVFTPPCLVQEGKIIMTLMGLFVINLTNLLDSRIHVKEEISPHHEQIAHLGTRGGPSSHR